jgi:hypothetical protein
MSWLIPLIEINLTRGSGRIRVRDAGCQQRQLDQQPYEGIAPQGFRLLCLAELIFVVLT